MGDPAVDLMVAWTFLPVDGRTVFRAALSVDAATWARGRGWGLAMMLPCPADFSDTGPVGAAGARRLIEELIADHRQDDSAVFLRSP